VTVGIESTGDAGWFHTLMQRLGHTLLVGDAAKMRAMVVRKTKSDRRDALHVLDLLRHDRFPTIWGPDPATRDLRALLTHRMRLVRIRTMNTTSCAACANGWLVDACRRGHRDLGSDLVRRGHGDGYQGLAAPPIVDPEAIVRLPFLPARLQKEIDSTRAS
jgi:hypothetical protein